MTALNNYETTHTTTFLILVFFARKANALAIILLGTIKSCLTVSHPPQLTQKGVLTK